MRLFGWKASREGGRPALSRGGSGVALGEWPRSYEAQVRDGFAGNAIAQRAVKLVAEGVGWAPLTASTPALLTLVQTRSTGQALLETVAAQMLLHGNAYVQVLRDAGGGVTGASVAPPAPVHGMVAPQPDGGLAIGWVRRSRAGWSWGDGADVPLAEETERYRVTLTAAGSARTFDVTAPRLALSAAERPHGMTTVRIVQQGTLAPSPAAEFTFDAGG